MARWTDESGYTHDTDLLPYGDQGDTRYWSGKPGDVGSVLFDRPRDDEGAQPSWTVSDPSRPTPDWDRPRQPSYGFDWSNVPRDSMLYRLFGGQSAPDAGGRDGGMGMPVSTGAGDVDPAVYGAASELAAQAYSRIKRVPLEQARTDLQDPRNADLKRFLVDYALQGGLESLSLPGPSGESVGGRSWDRYWDVKAEGAVAQAEMDKREAEQRMALARTADERASATLALQEADRRLAYLNYQQRQTDQYGEMARGLLSTAASLRGPRDYASFMRYTSGGRDLMSQLYGDRPRPAFSSPSSPMEPMTIESLLQDLGLVPGGTPRTGPTGSVPLPYQINPAVWDAMGPVGQELALSLAEAQGWDAQEYMRQINAARPRGAGAGTGVTRYLAPRAA